MKFTEAFTEARSPQFMDAKGECIRLEVRSRRLGRGWHGFNAVADDCEDHGVEAHARALRGDFGPIAKFKSPSAAEPRKPGKRKS